MGDALAADSNICAACLLVCTSSIWNFCLFKPYGSNANRAPCGGSRGCCGSCFQSGFDEDDFEKAERKAEEKRRSERKHDDHYEKESKEAEQNLAENVKPISDTTGQRTENNSVGETSPRVPDIVIHQPTPMHSMNEHPDSPH